LSLEVVLFLFYSNLSAIGDFEACKIVAGATGKPKSCHFCDTDLCNGSSKMSFNAVAMLVPFAIVIFSKLF
jgi:hypothetical protein